MIIGVHGKLRAGKDESFKQLEEIGKSKGIRFRRIAFADPLKAAAMASLGFDNEFDICESIKNDGTIDIVVDPVNGKGYFHENISGRQYLQNFGVAAREIYSDNFWVEQGMKSFSLDEDVVITDVRFENEAEAIREAGGFILYVYRKEDEPDGEHISEKKLPDHLIDFYIDNTKDIPNLKTNLRKTLNEILDYDDEYLQPNNPQYPTRESDINWQ